MNKTRIVNGLSEQEYIDEFNRLYKQINEPFLVEDVDGDYTKGQAGDFLMTGINGEHYIYSQKMFKNNYKLVILPKNTILKDGE